MIVLRLNRLSKSYIAQRISWCVLLRAHCFKSIRVKMPPAGPTFLRDCWRSFIARSYFATTARSIQQRKSHFRGEKIIFRRPPPAAAATDTD
jgi:hypothetical protein